MLAIGLFPQLLPFIKEDLASSVEDGIVISLGLSLGLFSQPNKELKGRKNLRPAESNSQTYFN